MGRAKISSLLGKIAVFVVICCLVMGSLFVNTAAALDGSGTQEDPWLIQSLEDFNNFAADANYWAGFTRLEIDVNLAGRTYSTAVIAPDIVNYNFVFDGTTFGGVFDGNDHKITDLTIDGGADNDFLGLFGCIAEEAQVSNLGLEGGYVSGDFFVGGLTGYSDGNVSNCYSTGDVISNWDNIGGLVGENNGSVSNCYSTGDVSSGNLFVGGLVGTNRDGYISDCYSTGNVSGTYSIGGLVGLHSGIGIISNCYSTGSVSGRHKVGGLAGANYGSVYHCYSNGDVDGAGWFGGLIGDNAGSVSHCYSKSDVKGSDMCMWSGGLIGINSGSISHCYSTGDVSGFAFVGGLLGENWETGNVSNCYSIGAVNGSDNVGGLVGDNYSSVSNCYSVGDVNGINVVGGLVGNNWEYGIISNCFWDIENQTHGITESIAFNFGTITNVSGLMTIQMQTKSTFTDAGWDFINVWNIGENQTYPYLRTVSPSDINKDHITNLLDIRIICDQWLQEE